MACIIVVTEKSLFVIDGAFANKEALFSEVSVEKNGLKKRREKKEKGSVRPRFLPVRLSYMLLRHLFHQCTGYSSMCFLTKYASSGSWFRFLE